MRASYALVAVALAATVVDGAVTDRYLPTCHCINFRNQLFSFNIGQEACAKTEAHDFKNELWCQKPSRPWIPGLHSGCPSGFHRCRVAFARPKFPLCHCVKYVNGATPTTSEGLCQKEGEETCYPRNEKPLSIVGNAEYYDCPIDTHRCDTPTPAPTPAPTSSPTSSPTASPTSSPTSSPTEVPTASPTASPTSSPSVAATASPTSSPTSSPTDLPSSSPTDLPSSAPTDLPSSSPTDLPSSAPTDLPSSAPTDLPSSTPTEVPTGSPTLAPTATPTPEPTMKSTKRMRALEMASDRTKVDAENSWDEDEA